MVISEVPTSEKELLAMLKAVEAGEEMTLTRGNRQVVRMSPVPPKIHAKAIDGLRPPTDPGRPLPPLVFAKDGGFVGAVDALIAERDAKR